MKKTNVKPASLTIKEISTRTGLSISYISRCLRGERQPRLHNAKLLADALGLTLDDLYKKLKGFYND